MCQWELSRFGGSTFGMPTAPIVKKASPLARANLVIQRLKAQADKGRETGTMVVKQLVTQGETCGTAYVAGLADQRYGTADAKTGIKQHSTNGIPTAALAGAALDIAAGFGMFGEYQRDAFALATGGLAHFASTQGRMTAIKLEQRMAERADARAAAAAPAQVGPAQPSAAQVATPAQVAQPVAVAAVAAGAGS